MQANQNKEFIPCFPSAGRCSVTSRKAGSIVHADFLGRQMPSLWTSSSFFPPVMIAAYDTIWCGISLWSVVWLGPLPSSFASWASPLAGQHEKQKSPWIGNNFSATIRTLVYYHRYFHQNSETQPYMSLYRENYLCLSQNHDKHTALSSHLGIEKELLTIQPTGILKSYPVHS